MLQIGPGELILIFFVIYLLFGPNALLQIARTLGTWVAKWKKGMDEFQQDLTHPDNKSENKKQNHDQR